jgi:hypothetical protein
LAPNVPWIPRVCCSKPKKMMILMGINRLNGTKWYYIVLND